MVFPDENFNSKFRKSRQAARSFSYACVRLPHLPAYRMATPAIPLPGSTKRIYCYHVRKTGGTTLAHAFLALGGEDPRIVEWRMKHPPFCTASGLYRFAYQDPPLVRRGYYFFGYGHKPAELIRLPEHTFTITILRDPIDRIVSLYRYLADSQADRGHAFQALGYEREWAQDGFPQFLTRVSRVQLLNQLFTFSRAGNLAEAADRILRCDRVLRTDDLDQGIRSLAAFLRLPLATRRVRQSRFEYCPTDSEISRLRELLEPEYQLLSLLAERVQGHGAPEAAPSSVREIPVPRRVL